MGGSTRLLFRGLLFYNITGLGRAAASALRGHRPLTAHPIAASGWLVEKTGITAATVNKGLGHLEHLNIVEELTAQKRNRLFSCAGYIEIMSRGTELHGRQAEPVTLPSHQLAFPELENGARKASTAHSSTADGVGPVHGPVLELQMLHRADARSAWPSDSSQRRPWELRPFGQGVLSTRAVHRQRQTEDRLMLGRIVVRFMSNILNVAGVLVIVGSTIAGGSFASQANRSVVVGVLAGFTSSFLFVVVTFGIVFLVLEINNNLIRIREELQKRR